MSLIRDFTETIRYDLEARQLEPLRKRGIVLGLPKAPTEYGVTGSTYNTGIPVVCDDLSFLVCYNRLTIAQLMGNAHATVVMDLTVESVLTTHDLIPDLNRCFDLRLTPEDIVDSPINLTFGTTSLSITFTPECLWFTGTWAAIKLKGSYQMVGGKIVKAIAGDMVLKYLDVINVGDATGTRFRMDCATRLFNYSNSTAELYAIPMRTGNWTWSYMTAAEATALATALKKTDGLPWVNGAAGTPWNLNGGAVVYNGPIEGYYARLTHGDDRALPALYDFRFNDIRKDKSHVMMVLPNSTYTTNLTFTPALIHYGSDMPAEFWTQADKAPVHHWPLYGADRTNKGTSEAKEPFPDIVQVAVSDGLSKPMVCLKAEGNYPLGFSWDAERDFTVSMRYVGRSTALINEGFFGEANGASNPGNVKMLSGWIPVLHYPNNTVKELDLLQRSNCYYQEFVITHVRRNGRYITYIDGKAIRECIIDAVYNPWTHFGRVGEYLKTTTVFADIKLFDYALNPEQVDKVVRGLL